jgi:hypothetical protein
MSIPLTTRIAFPIAPASETDKRASHLDRLGQGGYRSVQTLADRDAILTERRKEGMLVYVIDEETIYQLTGTTYVPPDFDEDESEQYTGGTWEELELGGGGGGRKIEDHPLDTVWDIEHNFNQRIVSVQVVSTSGRQIIPDVNYVDDDNVRLIFANAVAGTAIIRK